MPKKPCIPYQQFIQKYASELYLTERKRKTYQPKLIATIVGSLGLSAATLVWALNTSNKALVTGLSFGLSAILIAAMVIGIYFWNQFRIMHKERVLKMLVEEYFPQLAFTYLKKKNLPSGFQPISEYLNDIGYWPAYKKLSLAAQDFIEGPIGQLEIILFEALIQHSASSETTHIIFDGIILEIRNIPSNANFEEIKSREKIKKALNAIFDFYKNDYPKLFPSPNGHWYLFLEHSKTYLEPRGIKKSWSREELERLTGEFYYFIQFAEVLEAELSEIKNLSEEDPTL